MIIATPWLDALQSHLTAVQHGGAEEDVHQLRVATRRLSSWLKLGRLRVLRSDLRWLRAAGGGVRDLDVMLAQAPPEPMATWLREERGRRFDQLLEIAAAPRTAALCAALAHIAPVDEARARQSLPRLARSVLEQGDELQRSPNDVESFHQLRRSVRGLRYALEWLEEKTGAFKEFQDLSGRGADLSVALLLLDIYPEAAGLADYRHQLESEFARGRIESVGAWPGLREVVEGFA
jgi:CHAD domain-containing protein